MTAARDTQRRYRARKAAQGLCIYGGCKEPHLPGISSCLKHSGRKLAPKRCDWTGCYVLLSGPGFKYCPEDRVKARQRSNRASRRRNYYRRKERGICVGHGCHERAVEGRAMCRGCLERNVARQKERGKPK